MRREAVVRRLYNEGWVVGNFDVVFELLDPGIVWTAIEEAPDAGTYRGHEGVRAYMQDWLDDFHLESNLIEQSTEVGDRLVCAQIGAATGKGSGVRAELRYACVYTFGDDERIVELSEYGAHEEALAAARRASA